MFFLAKQRSNLQKFVIKIQQAELRIIPWKKKNQRRPKANILEPIKISQKLAIQKLVNRHQHNSIREGFCRSLELKQQCTGLLRQNDWLRLIITCFCLVKKAFQKFTFCSHCPREFSLFPIIVFVQIVQFIESDERWLCPIYVLNIIFQYWHQSKRK